MTSLIVQRHAYCDVLNFRMFSLTFVMLHFLMTDQKKRHVMHGRDLCGMKTVKLWVRDSLFALNHVTNYGVHWLNSAVVKHTKV